MRVLSLAAMSDPVQRIEAALARIEAAARARADDRRDLSRRHAQLRTRVAEAVAAIDELAAREPA